MANSLLHDCRGGSFTSPPCGEDWCRSCGPGLEALWHLHLDDQAREAAFLDQLSAAMDALEATVGALVGTPAFQAAVALFRRVDGDATGFHGADWHRARKATPTTTVVPDDDIPF